MLIITKNFDGDKAVFKLKGRLDTNTSPELEKELRESLGGVNELTLDFEGLEYISSAGLRVLLEAQMNMVARGGMKLIHVGDMAMQVFEVTGFAEILTIE